MRKSKKTKKIAKRAQKNKLKFPFHLELPEKTRYWIFATLMFLTGIVIFLSFFDKAGVAGGILKNGFFFLIGKATFAFPLFCILAGLALLSPKPKTGWQIFAAIFILTLGVAGVMGGIDLSQKEISDNFILNYDGEGGRIGNIISWPLFAVFGPWVAQLIFFTLIIIGVLILWQFLYYPREKEEEEEEEEAITIKESSENSQKSFIKKIFRPKFKVKEIDHDSSQLVISSSETTEEKQPENKKNLLSAFRTSHIPIELSSKNYPKQTDYPFPPTNLLEEDKGIPSAGDIKVNSAIIKRTLQNFNIQVEVSEINIGPTVTQYALKPAEGVKLSKIVSLSNNLSLALASHSIRIEAPIPGRPLIGIEIPNKARTLVGLRKLLEHPNFQNSVSPLILALGKDVSGLPTFADLTRMPHLLVAGSTGAGKTICLNNIILSLLYQNSPETLRLILVDPKRVEFPVYNEIPHLLTPVILNVQKTVNVLKWLVSEMERRFEVLSDAKARDIIIYNEKILKNSNFSSNSNDSEEEEKDEIMPYIVLVVDELADLMSSKGKEIEATIVRLAQMARAVGIHLIIATQRPSVDVITGLIKANITSRIAFQVASQIDSRTILDIAGAEKLLGSGDMLFISTDIIKAKRVQGAYVSDKEVRRVINYIQSKVKLKFSPEEDELSKRIEEETKEAGKSFDVLGSEEEPLYDEAKKIVIEAKKASASLLQRRLRIGYARAARLIDMMEDKGVVGPGEGAKPREVYFDQE